VTGLYEGPTEKTSVVVLWRHQIITQRNFCCCFFKSPIVMLLWDASMNCRIAELIAIIGLMIQRTSLH